MSCCTLFDASEIGQNSRFQFLVTPLAKYFEYLKSNGTELATCCLGLECQARSFEYTSFYTRIYDHFCDVNQTSSTSNFYEFYDEWYIRSATFCTPYSVSSNLTDWEADRPTSFNQMKAGCKFGSTFVVLILFVLMFLITTASALVLFVVVRDRRFHSAWGIYKCSLALSDLLVGIVICPLAIAQYLIRQLTVFKFDNNDMPTSTDLFSIHFINCMGVFTVLTIVTSVYRVL